MTKSRLLFALTGCLSLCIASGPTKSVPIGSYNFYLIGGPGVPPPATLKVTALAQDGTKLAQEFMFGNGTTPESARDTVLLTLQTDKIWNVSAAGATGINILGTLKGSAISQVDSGFSEPGPRTDLAISVDTSGGVKEGPPAPPGKEYKFAFLPLDGSGELTSSGTVAATVDGVSVPGVPVFAGEDGDAVAAALAGVMTLAGIPVLPPSGDEITILGDASGQSIGSTDLVLAATGLETQILLPVTEPLSLSLLTVGLIGFLVVRRYNCATAVRS